MTDLVVTVLGAAFGLAVLSAAAGFGGGVLLLPVFTDLFGLRCRADAHADSAVQQRVTRLAQPPRAALADDRLVGAWVGKKIFGRISDRVFVLLVEVGLVAAGMLILAGL